ncbi:MAX-interacting protein, putative [Pediculus humanus corporis]|uniref:MAX-interacting protein, putative n=1 Tax=Pediculus humanus subsp. corporis TaxID=121224 RepID=E0VNE8_PEDHC|nr:MAX-interacting protein, putative [Pediculus humanus corporis]EEB14904.1 MAX-interacting protein, putative [Pediculus humanus corporis]
MRRAHLRHCLEKLKELVPLTPEASRHTTLGLLTKAERYIKSLEDKFRRQTLFLEKLQRENRYLNRRLDSLHKQVALSKRRSVSECSTNTISSISTNLSTGSPSISESDEVDVIGYTSNQSDTDDYSSAQSSSDSGVAMSTSRLTLSEMEIF